MDKKSIIRIITSCAKEYNLNLENKNLLFIFNSKFSNIEYFETLFLPKHFLHLTGVISNKNIKSSNFYNMCLKGKLSPKDFKIAENGTTDMKLSILLQLMKLTKNVKMVGDYDDTKTFLKTEKIAGNVYASMGFIKDGSYYIPNTVLREDIRNITIKPQKNIILILEKQVKDANYNNIKYYNKNTNIDLSSLPKELLQKIDLDKISVQEIRNIKAD